MSDDSTEAPEAPTEPIWLMVHRPLTMNGKRVGGDVWGTIYDLRTGETKGGHVSSNLSFLWGDLLRKVADEAREAVGWAPAEYGGSFGDRESPLIVMAPADDVPPALAAKVPALAADAAATEAVKAWEDATHWPTRADVLVGLSARFLSGRDNLGSATADVLAAEALALLDDLGMGPDDVRDLWAGSDDKAVPENERPTDAQFLAQFLGATPNDRLKWIAKIRADSEVAHRAFITNVFERVEQQEDEIRALRAELAVARTADDDGAKAYLASRQSSIKELQEQIGNLDLDEGTREEARQELDGMMLEVAWRQAMVITFGTGGPHDDLTVLLDDDGDVREATYEYVWGSTRYTRKIHDSEPMHGLAADVAAMRPE